MPFPPARVEARVVRPPDGGTVTLCLCPLPRGSAFGVTEVPALPRVLSDLGRGELWAGLAGPREAT